MGETPCKVSVTKTYVEMCEASGRVGEKTNDTPMTDGRYAKYRARAATFASVQPLLAYAAANLDDDVSLTALSGQAGLSAFHLHRVLSAVIGETPKQLAMRLRLAYAAATLLTTDKSVLSVALSCGFQSHEVFIRAFRRSFGLAPSTYRRRGFANRVTTTQARQHAALVSQVGPCIALYHIDKRKEPEMSYAISRKELSAQPVLVVQRRVKLSEIGLTLAEVLPRVFQHAQQTGAAIVGQPFTRYLEWGPGLVTIEAGIPVVPSGNDSHDGKSTSGGSEIVAACLPGGPVATVTHSGPYEMLAEAHAAIQQWIEAQGLSAAGPPWETYTTDPADYPDPQDWKTDVFWPLAR
jgi:AraC-like DNA-binding protein/effector-binding domain-containing protein